MRRPLRLFMSEAQWRRIDPELWAQLKSMAGLPGLGEAVCVMPDLQRSEGFPSGTTLAFDRELDGLVCPSGVGFDIACGVRCLHASVNANEIRQQRKMLADALFRDLPVLAGHSLLHLTASQVDDMLTGGAAWAVKHGFGAPVDLDFLEDSGCVPGVDPGSIARPIKSRQRDELGTLGLDSHFLEVQSITEIFEPQIARQLGVQQDSALVMIHSGSRALGTQISHEFRERVATSSVRFGDACDCLCVPFDSSEGQDYLSALKAAVNGAHANRQILTHIVREVFDELLGARLRVISDLSHNSCLDERSGAASRLVHRKGVTRALAPGHPALPAGLSDVGQMIPIAGGMGKPTYLAVPGPESALALGSACRGTARLIHRDDRTLRPGEQVLDELAKRGIEVRCGSLKSIAGEAAEVYDDLDSVISVMQGAGLLKMIAKAEPIIVIRG